MTTREKTAFLPLAQPEFQRSMAERVKTIAWGAVQGPRRLKSLWVLAALAACAPAEPPPVLTEAARTTFILVDKSDRTLTLYGGDRALKTYNGLQFGDAPTGHKQFEGDERTPEGRYIIDARNPNSAYHLSLRISYPNAQDRAYAAARGRSPGGDIFLHGQPNGIGHGRVPGDWTDGCIALSNEQIEELWEAVSDGTPIEIRP